MLLTGLTVTAGVLLSDSQLGVSKLKIKKYEDEDSSSPSSFYGKKSEKKTKRVGEEGATEKGDEFVNKFRNIWIAKGQKLF